MLLQGFIFMQHGRSTDALKSFIAARDDISLATGPEHPLAQLYSLNVAIALEIMGRNKEGLAVVNFAEPILRRSMGADAPTYLRVIELRNRLQQETESGKFPSSGVEGRSRHGVVSNGYGEINFFN
jgi:hypothetical protein